MTAYRQIDSFYLLSVSFPRSWYILPVPEGDGSFCRLIRGARFLPTYTVLGIQSTVESCQVPLLHGHTSSWAPSLPTTPAGLLATSCVCSCALTNSRLMRREREQRVLFAHLPLLSANMSTRRIMDGVQGGTKVGMHGNSPRVRRRGMRTRW
jgi:hypothetical protein